MDKKKIEEIPDDMPVDTDFVKEVTGDLKSLSKDFVGNKMQEMHLIQQSVAEGGPGSPQEAIWNLMSYCKVGIRAAAVELKMSRKKLSRMIEGEIDLDPEVLDGLYKIFERKKPQLFRFGRQGDDEKSG